MMASEQHETAAFDDISSPVTYGMQRSVMNSSAAATTASACDIDLSTEMHDLCEQTNSELPPIDDHDDVEQLRGEASGADGDGGAQSSSSANSSFLVVEDDLLQKHCWVCFLTDDDSLSEDDMFAGLVAQDWVKPCKCKGTAKWVHQSCLQRWIDEKQKNNSSAKVACAQCKTEYLLVFPRQGSLVVALELYDKFLYAVSPFAAATALLGSIYCSACVYGAVTVCQVLGQDEGKQAIENADPLMLIVGLPSIPVMLILGKLVRWEDSILKLWKQYYMRIPLLSHLIGQPPEMPRESAEKILLGRDTFSEPLAATRMFCGALVLPTAAMLVGKYLYQRVSSNLQRTILGGLTFILAKGMLRIYLRQSQYIRHTRRAVVDWSEENEERAAREAKDKQHGIGGVVGVNVGVEIGLLHELDVDDERDNDQLLLNDPIEEPINLRAARDE